MKETRKLIVNRILSILTGVIAGAIVIGIGEMISHSFYPMPESLDQSDLQALKQHISELPLGAFIGALLAHGIGAIVGGFVASKMARVQKRGAALFTGLILLLAGVLNLVSIPHPMWFSIADVVLYTPMALLGYFLMDKFLNKNSATA